MGFVLFGLTGGLASGKSTVAAYWRSRGLPIIDADEVARDVVAPESPGLAEVALAFGEGILQRDGSLDRKSLGSLVFANPELRKKLESITHPRIALETRRRAAALEKGGEPLACYEASLLVERGMQESFRPLVVVAADVSTQIARAMQRDGSTSGDAHARMSAQLAIDEKIEVADYVIYNGGTLADLWQRSDEVLAAICKKLGIDPTRYRRGGDPEGAPQRV